MSKKKRLNNTTSRFNNITYKFVNLLMVAGKKSKARRIFALASLEFSRLLKVKNKDIKKEKPALAPGLSANVPLGPLGGLGALKMQPRQQREQERENNINLPLLKYKSRISEKKINRKSSNFLLQLKTLINNVRPIIQLKKCRISGSTKLIPAIYSYNTSLNLAMRWIIESAKKKRKSGKLEMYQCLGQELLDAYNKQGLPYERKMQLYKTSSANLSNLPYKWW